MEATVIDKIVSMVDELNNLNDRRFKDYGELRDIYVKQIELNKTLKSVCSQNDSGVEKKWLLQRSMSEQNVSLIPTVKLINMTEECVTYNNEILSKITDGVIVNFDKEKYLPEKNIDMVEVLQMCYENVSLVLKLKGRNIPNNLVYSDIRISELSIPELYVLYNGVKEANETLKGMM